MLSFNFYIGRNQHHVRYGLHLHGDSKISAMVYNHFNYAIYHIEHITTLSVDCEESVLEVWRLIVKCKYRNLCHITIVHKKYVIPRLYETAQLCYTS